MHELLTPCTRCGVMCGSQHGRHIIDGKEVCTKCYDLDTLSQRNISAIFNGKKRRRKKR